MPSLFHNFFGFSLHFFTKLLHVIKQLRNEKINFRRLKLKIAILSDTHDHFWNAKKAFAQIVNYGISTVIHCGDLISPFMLEELEEFPVHMHLIVGNNTGDQLLLAKKCMERKDQVTLHGWHGYLEIENRKIAWVHDPFWGKTLAQQGIYDLVCFGHTHRWYLEKIKNTLLLNPGEILGRKEPPGWALLDLKDMNIKRIFISD